MLDLNCEIQKLNNRLLKNGEKHQIVNDITNKMKNKRYSQNQIKEYLESEIKKKSTFDKRLYVNFIIEIKNDEILIGALLSEDEELIDDIIKRCDFFWSNEKYALEFYSSKIFPKVSYSQRNRILKAIEKNIENPEYALKFFDEITALYGIKVATPFLKRCSYEVWIEAIEHNIYLSDKDFLDIFKKRSSDILKYYQHLTELIENKKTTYHFNNEEYSETFIKLLHLYPDEIFKIIEIKDNIFSNFRASRKITKLFIKKFLNFVISDIIYIKYGRYNRFTLYKYLTKEQLETIISELFPEHSRSVSIPTVNNLLSHYFRLFKKNEIKLEVLQKCYKKVYGKELLDNKKNITLGLLQWMDNNDMRHKYAIEKYEIGDDDGTENIEYIPYMKIDVSIPKLKELAQTSNNTKDRKEYLVNLIKTCKINNDYNALLKVLKYLNTKHKNEQFIVRGGIISQLQYSFNDKLSTLTSEHWHEIYNMMCNFDKKSEFIECTYHLNVHLFIEAFKYSIPDQNMFTNWFDIFIRWSTLTRRLDSNLGKLENKQILLRAAEIVNNEYAANILNACINYNMKQRKKQSEKEKNLIIIEDHKWALDIIKKKIDKLKDPDCNNKTKFVEIINYIERDDGLAKYYSEKIIEIKREYLEKSDFNNLSYIIQFMPAGLDILPKLLPKLSDGCMEFLKSPSISFENKIKKANELKGIPGMDQILHEKCFEILKNRTTDQFKEYALWILYPYLSNTEFFEIIKPYYPTEKKANMGDDECQYKFMLQKRIAYCLRSFKSDQEALKALKTFCYGDFLQLTIGSLNSICQKIPYYKSKEFLESSINVPISFKKHVLRLLSILLEKALVTKLFKELWNKEKNPTIRKIVLEKVLRYLVTEYDNTIWWEILEQCIQKLDHKDKDIVQIFINLDHIPNIYLSRYSELMWKKMLEIEKEVPEVKEKRFKMLDSMNKNIIHLEDDLMKKLLNKYLFEINLKRNVHMKFCETAIRYILLKETSQSKSSDKLKLIIEKLQTAFKNYWNTYVEDEEEYPLRIFISDFMDEFINKILQTDIKENKTVKFIIINFIKMLKEIFKPDTYFYSYYLQFDFILIYYDVDQNSFEFGKAIRNIIDTEIEKYESIVVVQLAKDLENFQNYTASFEQLKSNELINGILHEPIQSNGCILIVYYLINLQNIVEEKEKRKYNEILLNSNDKRIKLYLNNNFQL